MPDEVLTIKKREGGNERVTLPIFDYFEFDAVRAATERTIALLKERRSALIAAAVTGQLDLGAAA